MKRPIMAQIAASLSDKLILTSDNPRHEEPERILDQMDAGIPIDAKFKVMRIVNRREAIKVAIQLAQAQDIVLTTDV